jgi:O-antigen/teichoic acid export membrane protein
MFALPLRAAFAGFARAIVTLASRGHNLCAVSEEASVTRNAVFAAATQVTTAAFTAALTLYLVRALGPGDYGLFALALGIGTVLVPVSDLGVTPSAARFIAEQRADRKVVAGIVTSAARLKLAALFPFCIALAALAGPIAAAYGNGDLAAPLRLMALALAGQSMFALYRETFVALGRISMTWRTVLLESAGETAASVALVAAGAGAAGAMLGRTAGYLAGALAAAYLVRRLLARLPRERRRGTQIRVRRLAAYAGVVFMIDAAFTLFEQIDVILIGAIIGTPAVAVFEAPLRLTTFLAYGGQALALAVAPRLARSGPPDLRAFTTATRYLVLLQGALLAPLLVWAEPIVDLALGPDYSGSAAVLRGLAPFVFLSGLGTYITIAVNYLGEARRRVPIAIVTVALNAALDLALLPTIGVVGGAVATDVAFALFVAGHFWICRTALGLPLAPLGRTLARCLAASAAMAGVLATAGTSSLSVAGWIAGSGAGILSYVAILRLVGELSRDEVSAARRAFSRFARRFK